MKSLGRSVGRGNKNSIVNQVMKNPKTRKIAIIKVGQLLLKEMLKACSAQKNSLFKDKSLSAIEQFEWSSASADLKRTAPLLYTILDTSIPKRSTIDRDISIAVCAGILLRSCSERANVIRLFSVLMFASHSPKQVYMHAVTIITFPLNIHSCIEDYRRQEFASHIGVQFVSLMRWVRVMTSLLRNGVI